MKMFELKALTGFVKVVINVAVVVALLVLVYIFGSFIYVMANADDLHKITASNLYSLPTFAREIGARAWEAEGEGVKFRLVHVFGEFSYLSMPRSMVLAIFLRLFGQWVLFFIGLVQMVNIFEDVSAGRPFVRENAKRLRIVGYAMAGSTLYAMLAQLGIFVLFWKQIMMKEASFTWYWFLKDAFSPGLLFGGLVVIVISEVFRLGNKLQEEHELTV
ncbi:MAG TPA: DUF2975 domain-containing protein [Candidatus Bathyarchaeia archaeon]|nr:DUF2975 domain-containing protein [Candidatus Bathyarchaeia archaeon]